MVIIVGAADYKFLNLMLLLINNNLLPTVQKIQKFQKLRCEKNIIFLLISLFDHLITEEDAEANWTYFKASPKSIVSEMPCFRLR